MVAYLSTSVQLLFGRTRVIGWREELRRRRCIRILASLRPARDTRRLYQESSPERFAHALQETRWNGFCCRYVNKPRLIVIVRLKPGPRCAAGRTKAAECTRAKRLPDDRRQCWPTNQAGNRPPTPASCLSIACLIK
jgi:hypothetical protein